jgi:hypothetical protein
MHIIGTIVVDFFRGLIGKAPDAWARPWRVRHYDLAGA